MSIRVRTAALLLFGSGFCALVYQTAWLREFRLIFGASTAASAAVLGVFMAGLGFGGIVLGRRVERSSRPLAFYGWLEILIAAAAAISPFLISLARQVYVSLGGTTVLGMTFGTIVRLLLVALILGVPTFLMGGTLPAIARAVVSGRDVSRRALGVLYGVNTLGAVTGALAGTFYMFENFGNRLSVLWAGVLNAAVALIAIRLSRATAGENLPASSEPASAEEQQTTAQARPGFVLAAAGIVGFAFFLMEIVWYRMLAPLLGGSTFTFGLILAIALLGIGLGGVVYSLFELKRAASMQFFAITCAAEALFMAVPYALGDRLAVMAMLLRPLGTIGFHGHVMAWSALCFIVVFPAAFIAGLQFPLLIALLGTGRRNIASQTGAAYASNTMGALIGSLAGGFGLMPLLTAPGVWKFVVVNLAGLGIVAACLPSGQSGWRRRVIIPLGTALAALTMLAATGPTAFWRHSQIGVGALREYHASTNDLRDIISGVRRRTMWQVDGLESSVAVANANSLSFIVNGKSDGNAKADAGTQIMCGMIGAALHPNPQRAMVVGLGTGSSAGWLGAIPGMERVDVVELERGILKVAEMCAPVNQRVLDNRKVQVTIGDAREVLLTTRDAYDLIVSEPSNPYRAGVAGLFTREFYQSVEQRLRPGGIFLQWVQTYDIDDRTVEIFYRTLGSVFGVIESWQTQDGDLLLMASREPVQYDAVKLRARLAEEPFRGAMIAGWRGRTLEDFLSHYVGNSNMAAGLAELQQWPLNTDDQTVIEFAFARSLSTANGFRVANLRKAARRAQCDRPEISNGTVDWAAVEEGKFCSFPLLALDDAGGSEGQRARAAAVLAYTKGDLANASRTWRSQKEQPSTLAELTMVAQFLAEEGNRSAIPYIEELARWLPGDGQAIRAELAFQQNDRARARDHLLRFFAMAHNDPWIGPELLGRSMVRAETLANADSSKETARLFHDALSTPLCVWNGETERTLRLLSLSQCLDGNVPGKNTLALIESLEPDLFWNRPFLEMRRKAYVGNDRGKAATAARDLDRFMDGEAFTADAPALVHVLEAASNRSMSGAYATEVQKKSGK